MKIKLTDQLHISSVSSDTLPAGSVVNVSDDTGADLVERGLATKIAAPPKNKARQAPKNK